MCRSIEERDFVFALVSWGSTTAEAVAHTSAGLEVLNYFRFRQSFVIFSRAMIESDSNPLGRGNLALGRKPDGSLNLVNEAQLQDLFPGLEVRNLDELAAAGDPLSASAEMLAQFPRRFAMWTDHKEIGNVVVPYVAADGKVTTRECDLSQALTILDRGAECGAADLVTCHAVESLGVAFEKAAPKAIHAIGASGFKDRALMARAREGETISCGAAHIRELILIASTAAQEPMNRLSQFVPTQSAIVVFSPAGRETECIGSVLPPFVDKPFKCFDGKEVASVRPFDRSLPVSRFAILSSSPLEMGADPKADVETRGPEKLVAPTLVGRLRGRLFQAVSKIDSPVIGGLEPLKNMRISQGLINILFARLSSEEATDVISLAQRVAQAREDCEIVNAIIQAVLTEFPAISP